MSHAVVQDMVADARWVHVRHFEDDGEWVYMRLDAYSVATLALEHTVYGIANRLLADGRSLFFPEASDLFAFELETGEARYVALDLSASAAAVWVDDENVYVVDAGQAPGHVCSYDQDAGKGVD